MYLIVYVYEGNGIGNVDGKFNHIPPTMEDIQKMQDEISQRFCFGKKVCIVNLIRITSPSEERMNERLDLFNGVD